MATEKIEEIILDENQDKEFTNGRGEGPMKPPKDGGEK